MTTSITTIQSNGADNFNEPKIHVAEKANLYGVRTGKLMHSGYRPVCGARITSAWGYTATQGTAADITCARCASRHSA